jgi:hypothetical protein
MEHVGAGKDGGDRLRTDEIPRELTDIIRGEE